MSSDSQPAVSVHAAVQSLQVPETAPLLLPAAGVESRETTHDFDHVTVWKLPCFKLVPSAFLAALAVATTAATEVYAYAVLTCKDPQRCDGSEKMSFAGTVTVAVAIANVCALLALAPLVRLGKRSPHRMLLCWLSLRSMSIVMLAIGVSIESIAVALSGRVFEGLASDNLLHLSLNAAYVQESPSVVPRLVGSSLAMYMLGICVGPAMASLLPSFQTSFVVALLIFASNFLYIWIVRPRGDRHASTIMTREAPGSGTEDDQIHVRQAILTVATPLKMLKVYISLMYPCISLMCYNLVQSFAFAAIMASTTLRFGFTSRQNGFVISVVHAIAALYLLGSLIAVPWLIKRMRRSDDKGKQPAEYRKTDHKSAFLATTSMTVESLALLLFAFIDKSWQVYPLAALIALGLSSPSFIKSYAATLVPHDKAPEAMAVLTIFETVGSLLAPLVIGGLMTGKPGPAAFVLCAVLMFTAGLLSLSAAILNRTRPVR